MTEVDFSALKCPPNITWTNTIKDLFTAEDVQHMIAQDGLNLADYSQVKAKSARIYAMVSTGRMPPADCTSDAPGQVRSCTHKNIFSFCAAAAISMA